MKTSLTGQLHTLRFSIRFAFPALLEMSRKTWRKKKQRNKKKEKKEQNKTSSCIINKWLAFLVCSIVQYFHSMFVFWRAVKASQNTAQ